MSKTVFTFGADSSELKEAISGLKNQFDSLADKAGDLNKKLKDSLETQKTLKDTSKALSEEAKEISKVKDEITKLDKTSKDYKATLQEKNSELKKLETSYSKQSALIEKANKEITKLTEKDNKYKAGLKAKQDTLKSLTEKYNSQEIAIKEAETAIASIDEKDKNYTKTLKEKKATLKELKSDFNKYDKAILSTKESITKIEGADKNYTQAIEDKRLELKKLDETYKGLEQEIRGVGAEVDKAIGKEKTHLEIIKEQKDKLDKLTSTYNLKNDALKESKKLNQEDINIAKANIKQYDEEKNKILSNIALSEKESKFKEESALKQSKIDSWVSDFRIDKQEEVNKAIEKEKALREQFQDKYVSSPDQSKQLKVKRELDALLKKNIISQNEYNLALQKEKQFTKEATAATGKMTGALVRHLRQVETLVIAFYTVREGFRKTIGVGLDMSKMIESNTYGIAALTSANTRMYDSLGNALTPMQKFVAGQKIAKDVLKELRLESLKTPATFKQLTEIYQQATGQTMAMGDAFGTTVESINKNTILMSQRLSNLGSAIGMPMDRLREEIRSLLSGNASTDSLISTMLFGSPGATNKAVAKAKESTEGLVKMLNEKFKDFDILATTQTYEKSILQLQGAWEIAMGDTVEKSGLFKDLTDSFSDMAKYITTHTDDIVDSFDNVYDKLSVLSMLSVPMGTLVDISLDLGAALKGVVEEVDNLFTKISGDKTLGAFGTSLLGVSVIFDTIYVGLHNTLTLISSIQGANIVGTIYNATQIDIDKLNNDMLSIDDLTDRYIKSYNKIKGISNKDTSKPITLDDGVNKAYELLTKKKFKTDEEYYKALEVLNAKVKVKMAKDDLKLITELNINKKVSADIDKFINKEESTSVKLQKQKADWVKEQVALNKKLAEEESRKIPITNSIDILKKAIKKTEEGILATTKKIADIDQEKADKARKALEDKITKESKMLSMKMQIADLDKQITGEKPSSKKDALSNEIQRLYDINELQVKKEDKLKYELKLREAIANYINSETEEIDKQNQAIEDTYNKYMQIVGSDYDKWLISTNQTMQDLAESGTLTAKQLQEVRDALDAKYDLKIGLEDIDETYDDMDRILEAQKESIQANLDWGESFNPIVDGIHNVMAAFSEQHTQEMDKKLELNEIDKKIEEDRLEVNLSKDTAIVKAQKQYKITIKEKKDKAKLDKKYAKKELDSYADLAGASASLFKEKTAAYKVLHAVEVGLHTAKMGMMITEMFMNQTKVATKVSLDAVDNASEISKTPAKGLNAILSQGSIPIIGFALMAAMAALVASFGGGSHGSGGSSVGGVDSSTIATSQNQSMMTEKTEQPILDRLDRQIELLEILGKSGTADTYKLELAKKQYAMDTKLKSEEIIRNAQSSTSMEHWNTQKDQDQLNKAWLEQFSKVNEELTTLNNGVETTLYKANYDYKGNVKSVDFQDDTFRDDPLTALSAVYKYGLDPTLSNSQAAQKEGAKGHDQILAWEIGDAAEKTGAIQQVTADYIESLNDVVESLKGAKDDFIDIYDQLNEQDTYSSKKFKDARDRVTQLAGDGSEESYSNYIKASIENINAVEAEYGDLSTLFLSQDVEDLKKQGKALNELNADIAEVYEEGGEKALNYKDDLILVGEAFVTSKENTKDWNDSFKNSDELLSDIADTIGVDVAQSAEELDELMLSLKNDTDGLTDADKELIDANKEYLESLGRIREKTMTLGEAYSTISDEIERQANEQIALAQAYDSTKIAIASKTAELEGYTLSLDNVTNAIGSFTDAKSATDALRLIDEYYKQQEKEIKENIKDQQDSYKNQIKILEAEEDVLRSFKDFADDLRTSQLTELLQTDALKSKFYTTFEDLNVAILAGDEDSKDLGQRTLDYATKYLDSLSETATTSEEYAFEQARIAKLLEEYQGTGETTTIDDLRTELEDLNDLTDDNNEALKELNDDTKTLLKTLDGNLDTAIAGTNAEIQDLIDVNKEYLGEESSIIKWLRNIETATKAISLDEYIAEKDIKEAKLVSDPTAEIEAIYKKYNIPIDTAGVEYWANDIQNGQSLSDVETSISTIANEKALADAYSTATTTSSALTAANNAISSGVLTAKDVSIATTPSYTAPTNISSSEQAVYDAFASVLNETPTAADVQYWSNNMDAGHMEEAVRTAAIKNDEIKGYATGGYTGNYGIDKVAGVVHGQEYVVNAQTTKDLGLNNSAGVFKEILKELADARQENKEIKQLMVKLTANSTKQVKIQRNIQSNTEEEVA